MSAAAPTRVRVRVPAKVNLFLAVRGVRADGMHEIVSVMHTIGLYDLLTVRFAEPTETWQHPVNRQRVDVVLADPGVPGVPTGEANLVVRAAQVLADHTGITVRALDPRSATREGAGLIELALEKSIPVAAGMAGGSADAAATLVALNKIWDCDLDRDDLRTLAAALGADVPFCLTGGTALATGTGVATAQVLCRGEYHWIVGIDQQPLSTAEVYRHWDEIGAPSVIEPDAVLQALRTRDPVALGAALHNDLESAALALRPILAERREALLDAGALGAVVSGSGPTLVALAETADDAQRVAAEVAPLFDRVETARSPAGGPEIGWR